MTGSSTRSRISSGARSDAWLNTEYNNHSSPSTFYTLGPETPVTAIDLISFSATGEENHVRVDWQTAQEIRNLGFNLYRSTSASGAFVKINDRLIPGLLYSVKGKSYSFADPNVSPGQLYYYKLEDIDASGTRTFHGPICVDWDADGMPDDWEIANGLNPWVNDAGHRCQQRRADQCCKNTNWDLIPLILTATEGRHLRRPGRLQD